MGKVRPRVRWPTLSLGRSLESRIPDGQSPHRCFDMLGNIWEWTSTLWGNSWKRSSFPYPYRPDDGRENNDAEADIFRIYRGGSFRDAPGKVNCASRRWYSPKQRNPRRGFRVAIGL